MSRITVEHLKTGIIFGDHHTHEYIYLPAGEVGVDAPLCVMETPQGRQDLPIIQAALAVVKLSLKPVSHPQFGRRSY